MKTIKIHNASTPSTTVTVKYCDTFLTKFKGLMFTKELQEDHGAILVHKDESRIDAAIHTLFMNYDLAVLWLDKQRVVVDKVLAKKWVPFFSPQKPAQYVVELHPSQLAGFSIGDQLHFRNEG